MYRPKFPLYLHRLASERRVSNSLVILLASTSASPALAVEGKKDTNTHRTNSVVKIAAPTDRRYPSVDSINVRELKCQSIRRTIKKSAIIRAINVAL
jgi:hypothetical protein